MVINFNVLYGYQFYVQKLDFLGSLIYMAINFNALYY